MSDQILTIEQELEEVKKQLQEKEIQLIEEQKKSIKAANTIVQYKDINSNLTDFPEIARQQAMLKYNIELMNHELSMAERFSKAKAFGDYTGEQIYTMMKAGKEMGLEPIESLQMLYIVNGKIKPYGDKMIAVLIKNGYKVQYLDECSETGKESVKVRVYHPENGFDETEIATSKDQIIQKSKAAGFALKNKLRFHGIRMIASFYLPHLFGSVSDEFTSDFIDDQNNQKTEVIEKAAAKVYEIPQDDKINDIKEAIENCQDRDDIKILMKQHSSIIGMNQELLQMIAKKKESFDQITSENV